MKPCRQLLFGLVALTLAPAAAPSAPPWQHIPATAQEALLGCRRCRCVCRCVPVVPVMPRAEQEVLLRLKFDKGPPYFSEVATDTQQTMKVMGQEVNQIQKQTFYLKWMPEGLDQNGNGLLKMKIIGAKMKIDIGGVNIEYESTADGIDQPAAFAPFFNALMDAEFRVSVTDQGKILAIKGMEGVVARLKAGNPQTEPLLKSIVNEAALKVLLAPHFAFVPKQAVRPGDVWDNEQSLELGPIGTFRTETKYTYGKSGPHEKILSRTTLTYDAPKIKDGLPFAIQSANLRATPSTGEIRFDSSRGRLVSGDSKLALEGTLMVEVGGVVTTVELRQTQTTRIRVTDTNPLNSLQKK
jgi:Family of unknown function (DUF6263)